ncbi:MAG: Legume-like lectin family protein [Verrucomicrobiales bacterium]|nr:Legume-like lectin family protein [Verrucomicrobiales bacterium]
MGGNGTPSMFRAARKINPRPSTNPPIFMKPGYITAVLGFSLAALPYARAGTFNANFNDGQIPPGAALFGNSGDNASGVIELTGGVGDSGVLKLTKAVNGKTGSMIIGDLDAGGPVKAFTANFKVRIGGGSNPPADGFAFCFAPDLPDGTFGEAGIGTGLTIGLDIYNNPDDAPAFKIYWNGAQVATTGILPLANVTTGADFVDMMVRVNPTGTLDLTYKGQPVFTNLVTGFQPIAGGRFGFGARTGGLNTNQFIDDISITTTPGDNLDPLILRDPISTRVVAGYPVPMNVRINGLMTPTFQWEKKAPGAASFTAIPGAQNATYIAPALAVADAGTMYRVVVTNGAGGSVTSAPAAFDVVSLPHATPNTASHNFNDGAVPNGTHVFGSAAVTPTGGFNDTGFMSLTEDVGGAAGTWIVDDLNGGNPVGSIDVAFKMLLTPADGAVPADGFGFHWAPDLPEAGFPNAEEPVGTGLSVGFDVYNNGNNEAPAVDVFWLGQRIGGTPVPGEFLNTLGQMVDAQIRLSADGKVDVALNGVVLVYQLQIPNWTAFSGARYGFAARTGGASQRQYIDEVQITSTPYAGAIGYVSQPAAATGVSGYTATFSVTSNDPLHTTYQWQSSTGGGAFTNIAGATDATYTTPALTAADDGRQYRARITSTVNASTADSTPALLTVVNLVGPAAGQAQILNNFDNETPNNVGTAPATVQTLSGNYNYSGGGFLTLTDAVNSQFGTLVIDDFNANQAVGGFNASMKVQIVGGAPADGWSFSWGTSIEPVQVYGGLESGVGNDLRVSFITYEGTGRSIRVNWRGAAIANIPVPITLLQTAEGEFEEVRIRVTPATATTEATLDVAQDGVLVIHNLALPGLTGIPGARFAIAARTGGLNETHSFDDLAISTSLYVGPITLLSQPPASQYVLVGKQVTLGVQSSNPPQTTYQWQKAAAGSNTFTNIPGATAATYTTPVLTSADAGTAYQAVLTAPSNVITSTPAVLTVVDPALPATWEVTIPFTNGEYPADGSLLGSAAALTEGGPGGTGTLNLTPAENGLQGSFILPDMDNGSAVDGFVTQFQLMIGNSASGNASNPPADGASFVWTREIISGAFGEGGTGTALIVSFDTYDNDDGNPDNELGEAPAIEAVWNGDSLGNIRVPRALLESGTDYRNVIVRVNSGGTLDVIFGETVLFWHKPLPGYAPITGGQFGWGARTGGLNAEQNVDNIQLSTFASVPANQPSISFSDSGGNVVVTFDGVLETSTDLINWTPQPAQASPLTVPRASLTGRLYLRARK